MTEHDRAKVMLGYVAAYYWQSRVYGAQNTAKGQEFDILRTIIDEMVEQFFPQRATWGLKRWEEMCGLTPKPSDTMEQRRQRVLAWLVMISPITVPVMRRICESAVNTEVEIKNNIAPYTFGIYFDLGSTHTADLFELVTIVEEAKPAHLAYWLYITLHAADCTVRSGAFLSADTETTVLPRYLERIDSGADIYGGAALTAEVSTAIMPQYLKRIDREATTCSAAALAAVVDHTISPVLLERIGGYVAAAGAASPSSVLSTTVEPYGFNGLDLANRSRPGAFLSHVYSVTINPLVGIGVEAASSIAFGGVAAAVQSTIINAREES